MPRRKKWYESERLPRKKKKFLQRVVGLQHPHSKEKWMNFWFAAHGSLKRSWF